MLRQIDNSFSNFYDPDLGEIEIGFEHITNEEIGEHYIKIKYNRVCVAILNDGCLQLVIFKNNSKNFVKLKDSEVILVPLDETYNYFRIKID